MRDALLRLLLFRVLLLETYLSVTQFLNFGLSELGSVARYAVPRSGTTVAVCLDGHGPEYAAAHEGDLGLSGARTAGDVFVPRLVWQTHDQSSSQRTLVPRSR